MEGGVAETDVEGGGGSAGDEAGDVEEGGQEWFVWVSVIWLILDAWSQGREDEEDGRCEKELNHHMEGGGEEWEVEVEVFGREHPFIVLRQLC